MKYFDLLSCKELTKDKLKLIQHNDVGVMYSVIKSHLKYVHLLVKLKEFKNHKNYNDSMIFTDFKTSSVCTVGFYFGKDIYQLNRNGFYCVASHCFTHKILFELNLWEYNI